MTKRMLESPPQWSKEEREKHKREMIKAVTDFFSQNEEYLLPFIKKHYKYKRAQIYKQLYVDTFRAPSQSKFYSDIKKADGVIPFLTHYFYQNFKECLEGLGLSPVAINEIVEKTEKRYYLNLNEAGNYSPSEEKIESADDFKAKPRKFKVSKKSRAMTYMSESSIREFYKEIYNSNELFYKANHDALYNLASMDYQDYLQSPYWLIVRSTALYRDSYKCVVCSAMATCVHHLSYDEDVLYGKDLTQVVSLCEPCHHKIEFSDDGNKISSISEKLCRYKQIMKKG